MKKEVKYLFAGAINTLFGYLISLVFYYSFHSTMNLVLILIGTNIVTITFSFLTYKVYVFETTGNWIQEYLKCYLVYGITAILSSTFVWALVEKLSVRYWIAQGLSIVIVVATSYILHRNYTFKGNNEKN